jgi:hypothetical protein
MGILKRNEKRQVRLSGDDIWFFNWNTMVSFRNKERSQPMISELFMTAKSKI